MPGTNGDRLTGCIKTTKRTKRQMYQRDVRSDGLRLTGYIKTPKRTKRQMYQRQVMFALPCLPVQQRRSDRGKWFSFFHKSRPARDDMWVGIISFFNYSRPARDDMWVGIISFFIIPVPLGTICG